MRARLPGIAFVLLEVGFLLLIPVLAVKGFDAVLNTTEGQAVDPELDPTDPGYEAFVEPSPVQLLLGTDDAGGLSWAAVLGLSPGDAGGVAVFVPPTLVVPDIPAAFLPEQTLATRYAVVGADGARLDASRALGIGLDDVVEVPPARMAELLAPVAPLTVANSDAIGDFDNGDLTLAADELAQLLLATDPTESQLTRLVRHEAVWTAWLDAVAASTDPDVVPGERSTGVGRFVRGLAAGPHAIRVPPLEEQPDPAIPEATAFAADLVAVSDFFEDLIPFPVASYPGARLRVRVLDGVGSEGLQLAVARDVVRAGGQVVLIGNSDSFDAETSRVVYFDPSLTERVDALAAMLGYEAELIEGANPDDRIDATVVAGNDAATAYGLSPRPTTNGGDAG